MAINYPTGIDTFTTKVDNTNDVMAVDINDVQDAAEALEIKVGINGSAVAASIDYLLKSTSSANPGHKHTLVNSATDVTATAGEINTACDGILATAAEINTACDGATAKNSHTHNQAGIDNAAVGQGELKTSSGSVSESLGALTLLTLPGGAYGFYPQIKSNSATAYLYYVKLWYNDGSNHSLGTSYTTHIALLGPGSPIVIYAQQYYVTASGEVHWIFILKEKNGPGLSVYQAPDHPCFGNRGIVHPFPNYDPLKYDIIVVNPTNEDVKRVTARCTPKIGGGYMTRADSLAGIEEDYTKPERDFMEAFWDMFELQENKEADWPDIPITVALPKIHKGKIISDWRFMPQFDQDSKPVKVKPIKRVISKPNYITPLRIKEK